MLKGCYFISFYAFRHIMSTNSKLIGIKSLQSVTKDITPVPRPAHGWLRAVREALGLSRARIAQKLRVSVPTIQNYEKREKADTITLASMRRMAAAMDCELVVTLVPRNGSSFVALAAEHDPATKHLRATEHSMALENQGSGDLEQRIHQHLS